MESAIIGGGCFWCVEAVIQRLKGIEKIEPGYAGGHAPGKPTYREVCSGRTGHAEVIKVTFDPNQINYETLLTVFMTTHDPTTLNRQGADVGTQYRSCIFYYNETQQRIAEKVKTEMQAYYDNPIVTEIAPAPTFYPAEQEHFNYYNEHPEQGYCRVVISPKVSKLKQKFQPLLKEV